MTATAAKMLNVARSQIGYREGANNDTKFGRWYGMNHQPWCAMFVSWCAVQADAAGIIPRHAYTPAGAAWFQLMGQWGHKPKVGAIVYFDWGPRIAHVGIVEAINADGSITTIEGNTNNTGSANGNGVYRMRRKAFIAGYGYPKYAPPPAQRRRPGVPMVSLAALTRASRKDPHRRQGGGTDGARDDVLVVEAALQRAGLLSSKYAKDGSFGSTTHDAYRAWQRKLGFRGRDADGRPGMSSLKALGKRYGFDVRRH